MNTGKETCEMLKAVRARIAEQYGLDYQPAECNHQGDCEGTCPRCDAELSDLQAQLEAKGISKIESDTLINEEYVRRLDEQKSEEVGTLQGIVPRPKDFHPAGVSVLEGDIRPISSETLKKQRKLYKKCFVAGIGFHDIEEIWDELFVGAKLALVRDKNNKHDKNAVAVALADDYEGDPDDFDFDFILGYLPRTENEHIATMMDMGWSELFECEISALNEHRPYQERIEIEIYITSKDDVEINTKIRALSLNEEEFQKVGKDLFAKGCTYFRWGGYPIWQHNLPEKNDSVVFIHRREDYSILYLMHVIAIGNEADPFVENKDELHCIDDCCHYVFTNVNGPLKCDNSELKFLDGEDIDVCQPEIYLSQEATDLLKMKFESVMLP